jgi:hypothetical protein
MNTEWDPSKCETKGRTKKRFDLRFQQPGTMSELQKILARRRSLIGEGDTQSQNVPKQAAPVQPAPIPPVAIASELSNKVHSTTKPSKEKEESAKSAADLGFLDALDVVPPYESEPARKADVNLGFAQSEANIVDTASCDEISGECQGQEQEQIQYSAANFDAGAEDVYDPVPTPSQTLVPQLVPLVPLSVPEDMLEINDACSNVGEASKTVTHMSSLSKLKMNAAAVPGLEEQTTADTLSDSTNQTANTETALPSSKKSASDLFNYVFENSDAAASPHLVVSTGGEDSLARKVSGPNGGDLYSTIDQLLEHREDFLGDLNQEMELLFEREALPRGAARASTTANPDADCVSGFKSLPRAFSVSTGGEGSKESRRTKSTRSLFEDDDGIDALSAGSDGEGGFLTAVSTPSAIAALGENSQSRGRFTAGNSRNSRFSTSSARYSTGSGASSFNSPEYMRDIFDELANEAVGTSSTLDIDNSARDPGLFDDSDEGSGVDRGLKDLDFLIGSGSRAVYSPRSLGFSEEGLGSSIHARESYVKKRLDADAMAADLLGEDFDKPSPVSSGRKSSAPTKVATSAAGGNSAVQSAAPTGKKKMDSALTEMDYDDFQHRLSIPQCADLRDVISKFIWSIGGPTGRGVAPTVFQDAPGPDYVFHGTKNLVNRCRDFFDAMDAHIRKHPRWIHEPEEKFSSIRDCLEQHCMLKVATIAYDASVSSESKIDDVQVFQKVKCLQFLKPEALDINPALHHERIWTVAGAELAKINSPAATTPGAKNACIVKCAAVIFRALSMASQKLSNGKEDGSTCGADDFLPLFIWVVLKAKVPNLFAHCDYIEAFLNPARLMAKDGYCLMNLRSALIFIKELSAESVSMDPDLFQRGFEKEQAKLDR